MPVLIPPNEQQRLVASENAGELLENSDLRVIQATVAMAARSLRCAHAAVTVVRQGAIEFAVTHEFPRERIDRDQFFCAHAILNDAPLIVRDATTDSRFARLSCVQDAPHLRFYAGVVIRSRRGDPIGTLSVFDAHARAQVEPDAGIMLESLAATVEDELHRLDVASTTRRPWTSPVARPQATPAQGEPTVRLRQEHTPNGLAPPIAAAVVANDVTPFVDRDKNAQSAANAMADHLHTHPELLQQIIDSNPNPVFIKDPLDYFVMVNTAGAALFGRSVEQMIGYREADVALTPVNDVDSFSGEFARVTTAISDTVRSHSPREEQFIDSEGRTRWFRTRRQALITDSAQAFILTIATDITALKAARVREQRHRDLTRIVSGSQRIDDVLSELAAHVEEHAHNGVCFVWARTSDGFACNVSRYVPDHIRKSVADVGATAWKVPSDPVGDRNTPLYSGPLIDNAYCAPYLSLDRFEGHHLTSYPICSAHGAPIGVIDVLDRRPERQTAEGHKAIFTIADLASIALEQRRRQSMLSYQAQYDPLTHLPNRYELKARVHRALHQARRTGNMVGLLYIDLDRFKQVNDTLGHSVGDALLREVAGRFETCLRQTDTLARMGGDEFAAVLTELTDTAGATRAAQKLMASLQRPFEIANFSLVVTITIGIAMYPNDGSEAGTLIRNANAALHRAKERDRGTFRFFAPDIHDNAMERLELETALRDAVASDALEMYLQPQIDLRTGKVNGFEALARWCHPQIGFISPGKFIPLAEELRLIRDIGTWALEEVCRAARYWMEFDGPPVTFGVNVSPIQLAHSSFVDTVADAVKRYELPPGTLECEITETAMMTDIEQVIPKLHRLRDLGVSISIDDFGTGYSSLAYLQRLPVDRVKIDRAFVSELAESENADPTTAGLVPVIINMAHTLGFSVVAEGVETRSQLDFLRRARCEVAQGYLFGRPTRAQNALDSMLRHYGRR